MSEIRTLTRNGVVFYPLTNISAVTGRNGFEYRGIATPSTNPDTNVTNILYIATQAGTYTHFLDSNSDPLILTEGLNVLMYSSGVWSTEQILGIDDEPTSGSANLVNSDGIYTKESAQDTTISGIQDDITAIQGDITTINGDIDNIEGDITTIQGDITTINGDIDTIEGNVTTIQGNITTIQGNITTLQGDVLKATFIDMSQSDWDALPDADKNPNRYYAIYEDE